MPGLTVAAEPGARGAREGHVDVLEAAVEVGRREEGGARRLAEHAPSADANTGHRAHMLRQAGEIHCSVTDTWINGQAMETICYYGKTLRQVKDTVGRRMGTLSQRMETPAKVIFRLHHRSF